ncbi:MAG: V-type ATPase subunit [Bacilli bacterium]
MNYPYANGIIKAQENTILDKAKLIRFSHDTPVAMMRELKEVGYGSAEDATLEDLISTEMSKVKQGIAKIAPEPSLIRLLFISDDAINLKMLLKKKLFGYARALHYAKNGAFDPEELAMWVESKMPLIDKKWNKGLAPLLELTVDEVSPRNLSSRVDDLIFRLAASSMKPFQTGALKEYFEKKIDYTNLISLVRARKLEWPILEFETMILSGGTISKEKLLEIYPLSDQDILQELLAYDYGKITADLKVCFTRDDLGLLEIYFENRLLSKMKEYHAEPFTIGPMLYYVLMKKAEATNIRTIASNPDFDAQYLLDY